MALPVLSVARMRAWEDASWAAGAREQDVIGRVGRALARRLRALVPRGGRVLLLAGRGHNGDDVRAALPALDGLAVDLVDATDPAAALAPLRDALARRPDWIVDGLFGIGLNRPLSAGWRELIAAANDAAVPILAMDVPSGLDADTGRDWGAAIRATLTLTVGAPKRGLLAAAAAGCIGRLEVAEDVGLAPAIPGAPAIPEATADDERDWRWTTASDLAGFPPPRAAESHKGDFGHVAILAGSVGWHGAAVLAARGAQRAMPGLVSVFVQRDAWAPVASQLAAAMVHPWRDAATVPAKCTALVAGPGLAHPDASRDFRAAVLGAWRDFAGPMVVDASALDWLEPGGITAGPRVVTPHPGEAARLLGTASAAVQADRPAAARALSARFAGCVVVLKGRHTLVGRAAGELRWNPTGNASMAQGGTGDVLAGFLGGLLAQPAWASDPMRAAWTAAWLHGAAGDRLAAAGAPWTAEDLAREIGRPENPGTNSQRGGDDAV